MKELNLKMSVDEVNLILEGVGNLPFVRVYGLVEKINQQVGQQLNGGAENPREDRQKTPAPAITDEREA